MLLDRLIAPVSPHRVWGKTSLEINDVAYDSRDVKQGTLFVAIPRVGGGPTSGGYQHVSEAIERGATAVVVQVDGGIRGVTTVEVADARQALADISTEFFGHPSRELQLYGITGTDGKTTTSYFLEQIFASAGYQTGLVGTVEVKIGEQRESNEDRMTTPESLDLQRILRRMVKAGVTHAVLEASSHALALARLRGCRFKACALTNITGDHLEFHGSWEAYLETKVSLFTELAPQQPRILNRDDEQFDKFAARVGGPIITYGHHHDAEIRATEIREEKTGSAFRIQFGGEQAEAAIPLPGEFNVANALAATGLALKSGLSLNVVASGLKDVKPPEGRFEVVKEGQPFEVVIDYAHTTRAFNCILRALRQRNGSGRLIAVFGAAGGRDRAKRPELARIAERYTDFFVITNEDPFGEEPEVIIDEVASGISEREEGSRFKREVERGKAIEAALKRARTGDTVVILGKGHEKSIVKNGRKEPWSDIATVRETLKRLA